MKTKELNNIEIYQDEAFYTCIFNEAVRKAKEINTKNGLPNDFVINGKTYYQLPNGEITDKNPLEEEDKNSKQIQS